MVVSSMMFAPVVSQYDWGLSPFEWEQDDMDRHRIPTEMVDESAGWTLVLFAAANVIILILFKAFIAPTRVEGMLAKKK